MLFASRNFLRYMNDDSQLRPVDLARAAGVSVQTVRRFEASAILPPSERLASGHRRFGRRHLDAIVAAVELTDTVGYAYASRIMRAASAGALTNAAIALDEAHSAIHAKRQARLAVVQHLTSVAHATRGHGARGLHVGEVSALLSVSESVLRFWELEGLISPQRDPRNGYRVYSQRDLDQVVLVQLMRASDYSIDEIRQIAAAAASGDYEGATRAVRSSLDELASASLRSLQAFALLLGSDGSAPATPSRVPRRRVEAP